MIQQLQTMMAVFLYTLLSAYGHLNAFKHFITEQQCDPNSRCFNGRTPLHCASDGGHMNIIQYLITELNCDPTTPNYYGSLPLHIACINGHLNATKYFITEQQCDPTSQGFNGWTLLHCASQGGHMNIIHYLITKLICDPKTPDNDGCLPLHIACVNGHFNVTKYLINEQQCDPNSRGFNGWTPLHCASQGGHMNIIQYLITELSCDPKINDNDGNLPLHNACANGHLNATKYFITEQKCDPTSQGFNGWTPLHCASQGGHMNIIHFLITEIDCDLSIVNNDERTILHLASYYGHVQIVQWLLHDGRLNILAKDRFGETCVDLAGHIKKRFKLLKLFQPFIKPPKLFPIHTCNKAILTGNSAAGKTTLGRVITERASSYFNLFKFGNVEQVETHTAGIVPSIVDSPEVGKMVIYDLAGHTEYHSSHSAIMETVMQQSPATFIHVIDLSSTESEITKQLCYWLNFIDSVTCKSSNKSCVIIVASHADLLTKEQLQSKLALISSIVLESVKRQEFIGIVSLDCRKLDSAGTREFISLLLKSHQVITSRTPSMSFYCHLLYAFLQSKPGISFCTFYELVSSLECEDSPIPTQVTILTQLLVALNDKGLIIFIQNQKQLEKSWIVIDTKTILKEIAGILFAPRGFTEHHQVSSSTGIVFSSNLEQHFPHYNLKMLVDFLQRLELCHRVNLSGNTTILQSIETYLHKDECYLFFPSLIESSRPDTRPGEENFSFGWCICCSDSDYQYFTSRFLHVLLLRLAYTFPRACDHAATISCQKCKCIVWTNGITWENDEGIRTVVELIDYKRCVVVAMSHKTDSRPVEYTKHRSAVIRLVLDLQQQLCPNVEISEYLISPSLLNNWSENWCACPSDTDLFPIENVANSMLLHKPYIHSRASTTIVISFVPKKYYSLSHIID